MVNIRFEQKYIGFGLAWGGLMCGHAFSLPVTDFYDGEHIMGHADSACSQVKGVNVYCSVPPHCQITCRLSAYTCNIILPPPCLSYTNLFGCAQITVVVWGSPVQNKVVKYILMLVT